MEVTPQIFFYELFIYDIIMGKKFGSLRLYLLNKDTYLDRTFPTKLTAISDYFLNRLYMFIENIHMFYQFIAKITILIIPFMYNYYLLNKDIYLVRPFPTKCTIL